MSLAVLDAAAIDVLLSRVGDTNLVAKGAVFVLGFDAIRERSGGRWAMRQDSVREFIERQFQKYFPPTDHLMRLDDVNFLVVQPSESGFGAQTRALKLLGEVLKFFLGAGAGRDVKLSRVTRIGPEGVETTQVEVSEADLSRLETLDWNALSSAGGGTEAATHARGGSFEAAGPVLSTIETDRKDNGTALRGDGDYEAMFRIEPIWSIKQRAVVSYRLRPSIFELQGDQMVAAETANITARDLVRLDLIVLAESARVFHDNGADTRFVLHVPIHHASLGTAASRQLVLAALERLQPVASSSIVVVLTGLESGAPNSQIVALTSALARRCRAVLALAPDLDCRVDRWRDAGLAGVVVDLNVLDKANERASIKRMTEFAARFKGVAPALLAYAVPNTAVLLAAWSVGFTHVGGELIEKYSDGLLQPLRLNPIDLYRDKL
jgi:hypothetical protein